MTETLTVVPTVAPPSLHCGGCGAAVPEEVLAAFSGPAAQQGPPLLCGCCGGPSVLADEDLTVADAHGFQRTWKMCRACSITSRGGFADAALLACMLAARAPQWAETAFELASVPTPLGAIPPGLDPASVAMGWSVFAAAMAGLLPLHAAQVTGFTGHPWGHVPDTVVESIVAELELERDRRGLESSPSGAPCVGCDTRHAYAGGWHQHRDFPTRPLCGDCWVPLKQYDLAEIQRLPQWPQPAPPTPGQLPCSQCAPPPEPEVEPVWDRGCGQCGGPTSRADQTVAVTDRNRHQATWSLCRVCASMNGRYDQDALVLLDMLGCTRPEAADLAGRASWLIQNPQPPHLDRLDMGWRHYAARIHGAVCRYDPHVDLSPHARSGQRWGHLPDTVVDRITADLNEQYEQRHPAAHPTGKPCQDCGRTEEVPARWAAGPLCGECAEVAQLRAEQAKARAKAKPVT